MILYFFITLLTVFIAWFVEIENRRLPCPDAYYGMEISRRQGLNTLCLWAIFAILFLLSALRLEVGNDYGTYTDVIHEIYVGGYVVTEPLFNAVVKLICILAGGENYLLVFAIFGLITIWLFLKVLYEQSDGFFLAFFLFMTLGIYFRTFNTIRYYFVLAITLYSFRYVFRKEYVKFILLIVLGAFFHKSVLVVIPLYLIAALPWKKWHLAVMLGAGGGLLLLQKPVMEIALLLYPSYRDTIYLQTETGLAGNLSTIARCIAVLMLALICYKDSIEGDRKNQFYFQLNILAIGLYSFGSFIPLVGRLGYYLITSHMLFIPSLLSGIQDKRKKKILTIAVIVISTLYFLLFLKTADQEGIRVLPYKSWLFYEKDFLNAGEIF